eukprot:TRINITY_DN4121_c0_g4_i1.p1 TRINITY_DN4121_c0_g4~~TRINITY_DN4121_c0_g4_i1.p1  ORF type:complete len:143 (+),score=35.95 TRINITY_DN4121_c0_g4_i1:24-431(+)
MIRRPPRSTPLYSSAASDVYKRQVLKNQLNYNATTFQRKQRVIEELSKKVAELQPKEKKETEASSTLFDKLKLISLLKEEYAQLRNRYEEETRIVSQIKTQLNSQIANMREILNRKITIRRNASLGLFKKRRLYA